MWTKLSALAARLGKPSGQSVRADATLVGIGALAGTLGSLVGLGGAFVIIPILTGPLGMSAHNAIGTSMAAVLATSAGSVSSYSKHESISETSRVNTIFNTGIPRTYGSIDVAAVLCLVSSAAICAPLGARFSKRISDLYIRRAQSILMMFAGSSLAFRDIIVEKCKTGGATNIPQVSDTSESLHAESRVRSDKSLKLDEGIKLGGIGVVSGFCAGFFGVGGGAIVVPALAIILDYDQKTALGTSLAAMLPTSLSGAIVHYLQGTMIARKALPLSVGCIVGSLLGGRLSAHINDTYLKNLFSCTVFGLGIRAFIKAF